MALTPTLYISTLFTQLYALCIHFPRPTTGTFSKPLHFITLFTLTTLCTLLSLPLLYRHPPISTLARTTSTTLQTLSILLFTWTAKTTHAGTLNAIFGGTIPGFVIAEGPFAWVRHPSYTAYLLGWTGACVAMGGQGWRQGVLGTCVLGLGCVYRVAAVGEEEAFLENGGSVGEEYRGYCERVRYRWLPGFA